MRAVDTVLLDAGNTLLELDYPHIAEVIRGSGLEVTPAEVRRAEHRARVEVDELLARAGSTEADETFRRYVQGVLAHLGHPDEESLQPVLTGLGADRSTLWRIPAPDARDVLQELARRGYTCGVVSNSDGSVESLLEAAGLGPHLEVVIDSAVVGVEKPDARIFEIALAALGRPARAAAYVGDLVSVDVAGAQAAGVQPILVDPSRLRDGLPCPRVATLTDLLALLPPL